ncbi:ATP-binding protein [Vibrio sp. JC009]|uniref:ATP-binding protein n=1 Tax=Vibrio sp. JC009 TaxID=2912314 RepID=UPI0023B129DC|nr:ATP-binding protein [Vibrio sp. JC009]WED23620.1 ATP-binding protein [Vibrio sp. JC009]
MQNKISWLKKLSIRQRLLLTASLWIGGLILAAGAIVPILVNSFLVDTAKANLKITGDEIISNLTLDDKGALTLRQGISDLRFNQPHSGYYWRVTGKEQILRSRSLRDKNIEAKGKYSYRLTGKNGEKLIFVRQEITIPELQHPLTIIVAADEDPVEETLDSVIEGLTSILFILFLGLMIFTFVQVNWSLRPLNKLQAELKALEKGEREELSAEYPGEIEPLITDLNALLFHYQELLERARNHAGNLSHSLKTPLSVLKNQTAELPQQQKEALSETISQLQQQIDYHLSRARMAGSMNILSVKSNPCERVDAIASAFDKVYAQRELVLVNELDDEIFVAVEDADLDEMLGNLIENSYKWASSLIRVYSEKGTGEAAVQVKLIIEDDGEGIEPDKLGEIVKRGVRLDESRPGSGLGLNIVAEMAHSYRGSLSFERSSMGGLKASLLLNLSR